MMIASGVALLLAAAPEAKPAGPEPQAAVDACQGRVGCRCSDDSIREFQVP